MVNSRAKGIKGERDVANYLNQFPEWPDARRRVASGWSNGSTEHVDEGDLAGTDPFCVQVKSLARPLIGKLLDDTWRETVAQSVVNNLHPLIVEKRTGTKDVGRWWAHLNCRLYVMLLTGRPQLVMADHLMRVELGNIIENMRMFCRDMR